MWPQSHPEDGKPGRGDCRQSLTEALFGGVSTEVTQLNKVTSVGVQHEWGPHRRGMRAHTHSGRTVWGPGKAVPSSPGEGFRRNQLCSFSISDPRM